jgi:hypothetical protein
MALSAKFSMFEFDPEKFQISVVLAVLAAVAVTVTTIDIVRNVSFHPLSCFPGPRLAASSFWWSAYQQVIKGRSMHHICERLHEQYGKYFLELHHPPNAAG